MEPERHRRRNDHTDRLLTGLSQTGGNVPRVAFSGNGTIEDDNLTTLDGVDVTLDGTNTQAASPWKKFTNGSLTVSGGAYNLPGLTDVDGSDIRVESGGHLALPGLVSCIAKGSLVALGMGSVLDVSSLTNVQPANTHWSVGVIEGGELDLSGLASLAGSPHSIGLDDQYNGTLLDGNLTQLSGVDVTLDGTDSQAASSWTSLADGSLTVEYGACSLPNLTNLDGSDSSVRSAGQLALPGLVDCTAVGAFSADGAGSVLDVSALKEVSGRQGEWAISATNGGEIKLTGLSSLTNTDPVLFKVSFDGDGTILDDKLSSFQGVAITLDGSNAQAAEAWTSIVNGSLAVTGGSYRLPGLTDVDGSSLSVRNGAILTLPGLVSYQSGGTFQAAGAGSLLDVSALTSIGKGQSPWTIEPTDGGVVDLTGLTNLANTAPGLLAINFSGNGTILDGNLASLDRVARPLTARIRRSPIFGANSPTEASPSAADHIGCCVCRMSMAQACSQTRAVR